mmetsp:Transcript_64408/g.178474  ORF Transcript_64408/g.178474 Transcript_64408/m.178474 type:complete len:138 (+) Transcript_64408:185-598(+)
MSMCSPGCPVLTCLRPPTPRRPLTYIHDAPVTGSKLVSASADATSRVFNTMTGACQAILVGHEPGGEISKVCFNPQGSRILTASSDKTARLWEIETGGCMQILEGHTDEIFSCAFNYEGDTVITGSKDNTCRIWRCS